MLMAVLIMLQALIRLLTADNFHVFTGFMLTFYLFVFGLVLIFIECNMFRCRVWFYFMNFSLGKSIFYFVMTLLCFGSGTEIAFFDVLIGIVCGLLCILFGFFHLTFKDEEPTYVQKLIEQMNKRQEERETKTVSAPSATVNINQV